MERIKIREDLQDLFAAIDRDHAGAAGREPDHWKQLSRAVERC
jgi:hypothetical protein